MKIAIIITHPIKGSSGTFERMHEIAKHLKSETINPIILTPFKEDISNVKDIEMRWIPNSLSTFGISTFVYKLVRKINSSRQGFKLFISDNSMNILTSNLEKGLSKIFEKEKFDIIHAVQPIAALASSNLSKKYNLPLVVELNNSWPDEAVSNGLIAPNDKNILKLKQLQQKSIDSAHLIHVVSDFGKNHLIQNYQVNSKKIIIVPAAGIINQDAENLNRENNVVYAGSVNPRSRVDIFASAIPYVKSNSSFSISNMGDDLKRIKNITSQNRFSSINYFWFPKRIDLIQFLINSKIGISTFQNDITWKIGIPLKPFDYISCGLPVIVNDVGNWWSDVIKQENIGLVTSSDPKSFAESIDIIMNDEKLWNTMHENALGLVKKKLNWRKVCDDILIPSYNKLIN